MWIYAGDVLIWGHAFHIDGPLSPEAKALVDAIEAWSLVARSGRKSEPNG